MEQQGLILLKILREAGFEAYWVGGCVRDRLLGHPLKDIDIATSARPAEVGRLFPDSRFVGASFGVTLVRREEWDFEVATFRRDGHYSDGRHPDHVEFGTLEQDALRRDFTVNALYFDPISELVIDRVGGVDDLRAGVLRTVGKPRERFREDALRLLRAVRFAARFGFKHRPRYLAGHGAFGPLGRCDQH
jgi:tRNA nucleotidyltransferase/poly(A) polymerase